MTLGIGIFSIAFIGSDDVVNRIEKIEDETSANKMNRFGIWAATAKLVKDNPVLGTGFGAYSTSIPKYVETAGGWEIEQAHNEYLEILANGGVIAFALFGLFAVMVFKRAIKNFESYDPLARSRLLWRVDRDLWGTRSQRSGLWPAYHG